MIREAMPGDLADIRELERAAGAPFRLVGMDALAHDDPPALAQLDTFQSDGRAWVFTDPANVPVAYLLVDIVDQQAHVEQVSVHPEHAHQRVGQRLLEHAATWARARGLTCMTLTTYRDVPWHAPYYARLGFNVIEASQIGPGLEGVRSQEADQGLDRWPRVAMQRDITSA